VRSVWRQDGIPELSLGVGVEGYTQRDSGGLCDRSASALIALTLQYASICIEESCILNKSRQKSFDALGRDSFVM